MKLCDFVCTDAIISDMKSTSRDGVLRELVQALADAKRIPAESVEPLVKQLLKREQHGSTGFGKGVAVPHVKEQSITEMVATVGRSSRGIDFGALDQQAVYSIFLLLSPPDDPDRHLQAMECIFRHLQQDTFRRFLRQSDSREAIVDLLHEVDEGQS